MDYAYRDWSRAALAAVQSRVRVLSERLAGCYRLALPSESLSRKLRAGLLLVGAIIAGLFAHQLNDQEAESRWRKKHRPTQKIWDSSFASEGFRPLQNPATVARVLRTLPALVDSSGRVWKSDPEWWAIETPDGSQPRIYCLACDLKTLPKTWKNLGNGWESWEAAMQDAHDEAQRAAQATHPKRGPKEDFDPREIRY